MNQKIFTALATLGLLTIVSGHADVQKVIEGLKASHEKVKSALSAEQLSDISAMRSTLESLKDKYPVNPIDIDQPLLALPDMAFHKAIASLVETKSDLCHSEVILSDEGALKFNDECNNYVKTPCEVVSEAYSSSLDEYYRQIEEVPDLSKQIQAADPEEYEWMMNAGVCYNIMKDLQAVCLNSFVFVTCLRMLGF